MSQHANQVSRYEQLVLSSNTLREELHTEIDRILHDVIKFKIHVQKSLDEYEGFIADELRVEIGTELEDDHPQEDDY